MIYVWLEMDLTKWCIWPPFGKEPDTYPATGATNWIGLGPFYLCWRR